MAVYILAAAAWFLTRSSDIHLGGGLISKGSDVTNNGSCDLAGSSTPEDTAITFKDASGKVVGSVTTSKTPQTWVSPTSYACTISASYSLTLPRSSFYEVSISGVSQPLTVKLSDVSDGRLELSLP